MSAILERFEKFWINYPKKRNKGNAKKIWLRLKPDETLLKQMLDKIMEAKRSKDWCKENGQFIPYPSTWLSAECWNDDINMEIKPKKPDEKNYLTPEQRKKFDSDYRSGKTIGLKEIGVRIMADLKKKKRKG